LLALIRHVVVRVRFKLAFVRSWIWNWLMRVFVLRVLSGLRRVGLMPQRQHAAGEAGSAAPPEQSAQGLADDWDALVAQLVSAFDAAFPERADRLTPDDLSQWGFRRDDWQALFARYDIVQCYATDPIRALVTGKRPYVAFEHGTLRDFTLGDSALHRLNALAYRLSDHVFITNGDCLAFAERLGIEHYTPMVHPVDVEQHASDQGDEPQRIRRTLGGRVLLFCPLRHDWAIKGTDVHLHALPLILEEHGEDVVLALCDWGAETTASRALLSKLGCSDNVAWLPPLNRIELIRHMKAADVVLDQMALPHFGATAPQALAAGTPVIMSYRPESTAWIVEEPAPILAASDAPGVAEAVTTALEPGWRADFAERAREWVRRHHHPDRIIAAHCRVYRSILEEHT
jgi:glycosyltransferase involved in cell wall biosynthesis